MRSELPWVKVIPQQHDTLKGLLPTGKVLATTLSAGNLEMVRQRNNFSVISGPVVGQDPPCLAVRVQKGTGP